MIQNNYNNLYRYHSLPQKRRRNDNLEQQAQALFNYYFADQICDCSLGDIINTTSGGTPSRKRGDYYNGRVLWVKSKELNGDFIFNTEETITELGVNESSAKILPENSVLIAMYGATVGEFAIISKPMCCNQAICALLPNENTPYTYLYMIAKNKKQELINMAVGSAQQNISQILIKKIPISSNFSKISVFDKCVTPLFEMKRKNVSEIINLEKFRDSLLPKLMSGELKINDLNN